MLSMQFKKSDDTTKRKLTNLTREYVNLKTTTSNLKHINAQ